MPTVEQFNRGAAGLIPMAYMAGAGQAEQRRAELAQRRLENRERLQYGARQAGYDRLARERQLMFQAGVQGRRDEAIAQQRKGEAKLRREQQLFDQAAANEEWGRRDEVNELQALQGEFRELGEQPWDEEQMQRLQGTKKSLRLARESGTYDEEQMLKMTRDALNDWSMEEPEGEEMPEEFTPEWMLKNVGPSARIGENGSMYFELPDGQKRPFYLKPGAHGMEPVLIDEPDQVNEWGESQTEAASRQRDIEQKQREAEQSRNDKREEKAWALAEERAKNYNLTTAADDDKDTTNDSRSARYYIEEAREEMMERLPPLPPRLPDSMLPGLQPGEGGALPGEPTPAELAEGRLPIIPAAEAADLPVVESLEEFQALAPGEQYLSRNQATGEMELRQKPR